MKKYERSEVKSETKKLLQEASGEKIPRLSKKYIYEEDENTGKLTPTNKLELITFFILEYNPKQKAS